MAKIAVFPGSFDPFTKGHEAVVLKAANLFDKVIVAIGSNNSKKYLFSLEQRESMINAVFANMPTIEVKAFEGLTVDFCKKEGANYIVRGLRNAIDFQFEQSIANMNNALTPTLETVFLLTEQKYSAISSTIVREIYKNDGDIKQFIPKNMPL